MHKILCSAMGYDNGRSGVADYINEVVGELIKEHKVDLIILKSCSEKFPHKESENLRFIIKPDWLGHTIINMAYHLCVLPYTIDFSAYDFLFLPAGHRRLMRKCPIPTLATVHDLTELHIDGQIRIYKMFYLKKIIPHYLRKVDKVLAISENTRKDLITDYHIDDEKIVVNHNGYNPERYHQPGAPEKPDFEFLKKKKKYILYVSRIEYPCKNHLNLIKAYEMLSPELKDKYDLVLVGSKGKGGAKIHNYVEKSADKANIQFTGFVPNKVLPVLYQEASVFAFPSFYEGFGVPILEAMNSGIPVVCSNTSSLPEIGADAANYFHPESPGDIKFRLEEVLSDKTKRSEMRGKGFRRVKAFSWARHKDNIIKTYTELVNDTSNEDKQS